MVLKYFHKMHVVFYTSSLHATFPLTVKKKIPILCHTFRQQLLVMSETAIVLFLEHLADCKETWIHRHSDSTYLRTMVYDVLYPIS